MLKLYSLVSSVQSTISTKVGFINDCRSEVKELCFTNESRFEVKELCFTNESRSEVRSYVLPMRVDLW